MPDVTVASTTDSIEEVRQAAGLPAEEAEQQAEGTEPAFEVEGHEAEEVEAAAGEEAEGEDAELERPRPKTSVQKRIDKLTAKNYQLSEEATQAKKENDDLRKRLERLESIAAGQDKTEAPKADEFSKPRPQSKDFDDYDKFMDALTDWKLEKKDFEKEAAEKKTQATVAETKQAETFAAYNRAVSEARGQHEDFDEVVGNPKLTVPMSVQAAIVSMREDGPEVAYQLASNPEMCARLSELAVDRGDSIALVEFGKWVSANFEERQVESQPEPARRPVAAKPAPIKPVGGSATRSNVPLDQLDYRDYRRIRDEQARGRR